MDYSVSATLVKDVFIMLATLVLSLILWGLILGTASRKAQWKIIEPAFETNWKMATFDNGKNITSGIENTFNTARDESTY